MFQNLYPKEEQESVYTLDYESLFERGYRGIIFDIDNTLVAHGAPATDDAIALVARLRKMGFSVCFLSNNDKQRVGEFCKPMDAVYIFKACTLLHFSPLMTPDAVDVPFKISVLNESRNYILLKGRNGTRIKAKPRIKPAHKLLGQYHIADTQRRRDCFREGIQIDHIILIGEGKQRILRFR